MVMTEFCSIFKRIDNLGGIFDGGTYDMLWHISFTICNLECQPFLSLSEINKNRLNRLHYILVILFQY